MFDHWSMDATKTSLLAQITAAVIIWTLRHIVLYQLAVFELVYVCLPRLVSLLESLLPSNHENSSTD